MENICSVFDAQGFIQNGNFVAREFAVVSGNIKACFQVDTLIEKTLLSEKDFVTNLYIGKHITGLSLRPKENTKYISKEDLIIVMRHAFHKAKIYNRKGKVGIKNHQLAAILDRASIPYVELDVPSLDTLDSYYDGNWLCKHHDRDRAAACAIRKTEYMWKWLKEEEIFEKLLSDASGY